MSDYRPDHDPADYTGRPRPVKDAANTLTRQLGVAGSLILALVGWGTLTTTTGNALIGLLGLIPAIVNSVTTLLTATGIVHQAEPLVTPIADPRDNSGAALRAHSPPGDLGSGFLG